MVWSEYAKHCFNPPLAREQAETTDGLNDGKMSRRVSIRRLLVSKRKSGN